MNQMQNELPVLNSEQDRLARRERTLRIVMPTLAIIIALGIWEGLVRYYQVPHYLIPAPSLIAETLIKDGPSLTASMWFTVKLTLISLACAIIGGVLLGMIFCPIPPDRNGVLSLRRNPAGHTGHCYRAAHPHLCTRYIFCPVDLRTDRGVLSDPLQHGDRIAQRRPQSARSVQALPCLAMAAPALSAGTKRSALFHGRAKIAGGLSLIGAVVAEFVAGTAGQSTGLASRILESSFRNEIPRMFAALFLVSLLGIVIFLITSWLSRLVLGRWHESEIRRER